MKETTLIIGATGSVGLEIAKKLNEMNKLVKIAVRDPERAKNTSLKNTEFVKFDYFDENSLVNAFTNIQKVVLVSPPSYLKLQEKVNLAVDKALEKGVKLIVNISALSADSESEKPMKEVEEHIKNCGLDYVILRPNCYMQNFKDLFKDLIVEENQITVPAKNNKVCFVDIRDIADCTIKVLHDNKLINNTYKLTGEQSLNMHVVAHLFSEELKRDIEYNDVSENDFKKMLKNAGWPAGSIEGTIQLCNHVKNGTTNQKSDDIKYILGRDPIKFEKFISDYSEIWS